MATKKSDKQVSRKRLNAALRALREAGDEGLTRDGLRKAVDSKNARIANRIVDQLVEDGASIELRSDPKRRRRLFVMKRGPNWDKDLTPQTRVALRIAAQGLIQGGSATLGKQLEALERTLAESLSERDRRTLENLRKNVRVKGGAAEPATTAQLDVMEKVFSAFSKELPNMLEFHYRDPLAERLKAGETEDRPAAEGEQEPKPPRTVLPFCLTRDLLSGAIYLLAETLPEHEVRHFRLSRMTSVRVISRPALYQKREALQLAADHQVGGWCETTQPVGVSLRVRSPHWIQALLEAPPDFPEYELKILGPQSVRVTFMANAPKGLVRWILQMGADVTVEAPASLRDKLRKEAEDMVKLYPRDPSS